MTGPNPFKASLRVQGTGLGVGACRTRAGHPLGPRAPAQGWRVSPRAHGTPCGPTCRGVTVCSASLSHHLLVPSHRKTKVEKLLVSKGESI